MTTCLYLIASLSFCLALWNIEEIKNFCKVNCNESFPLFSKISVKGDDIHPLYEYLTSEDTNPGFAGEIP